jgi:DNA-binding NtrC family response regulator
MASENSYSLLIVEDDEDIRGILVDVLSPLAGTVHAVSDGEQGLELILKNDYDCVVSDIKMPILSGLELLKEVRSASKAVPFILVTGFGDQKAMCQALQLGATDFVDKPFDNAYIRESVRKSLTYGSLLKDVDRRIDELFSAADLPSAEVLKVKEMRRALWRMKAMSSVYLKGGKIA